MCCTAWIAAGPPGPVGEFDQSLDPQQLLAVIARQPAQRHGKAQPTHRPPQADRQGVDAVGMHRRRVGRGRGSALGEPPNSRALASASRRIDDRRQRVQRRQSLDEVVGDRGMIGLGQKQKVGHGGLRDRLGIAIERRRAEHGVDRRHDAVEPQRGFEEGVGGQRVEHRSRDRPGRWSRARCAGTAAGRRPAATSAAGRRSRPGPGARRSRCSRWAARPRRRPWPPAEDGRARRRRTR